MQLDDVEVVTITILNITWLQTQI